MPRPGVEGATTAGRNGALEIRHRTNRPLAGELLFTGWQFPAWRQTDHGVLELF
jgi:hypothetical protein